MGERLGRYETIALIATGGMASVYLGRAVGAGGFERRVAIKVMHPHIADDPDFEAMFLDEARLAARIHHPNVVATLDVQKSDRTMFLVMEYVEGCSLREILRPLRKRRERMPIGHALRIMSDALTGLHVAHELRAKGGALLNLVHRDVSPHNVLVGTDGVTRITDFGVARAEARLSSTRGGQLKGKIAYMPPEQGRGDVVDRRADIYAAAVVLWEMLVGRRLFQADHDGVLVAMILTGTETSPRDAEPSIPEPIDAACMKALAVPRVDRYPTAAAFVEALEEAAREAGVPIASQREIAEYIGEFKRVIPSTPPPRLTASDAMSSDTDSEVRAIDAPEAPLFGSEELGSEEPPGADEPSQASQTGTSELSGIGAVRSQRPKTAPASGRVIAVAAAAVAVAAVAGTIGWLSRTVEAPQANPAAAHSAEPAQPQPSQLAASSVPAGSASSTPPASAGKVAAGGAPAGRAAAGGAGGSATGSASATASGAPPLPPPTSTYTAPWTTKTKKGPLGFEPTDL